LLLETMKDPSSEVRIGALKALSSSHGSPTVCAEIIATLDDRDEDVRAPAVELLGSCKEGPQSVVDALFKSSRDPAAIVRAKAINVFGALLNTKRASDDTTTDELLSRLDDPVRGKGISTIVNALSDPDEPVRTAAAEALLEVAPIAIEYMPKIIEAVDSPFSEVHVATIRVLASFGQQASSCEPTLIRYLSDSDVN